MYKIKDKNGLLISLQTKNELSNITYDLIHQHLIYPGKKQHINLQILLEKPF